MRENISLVRGENGLLVCLHYPLSIFPNILLYFILQITRGWFMTFSIGTKLGCWRIKLHLLLWIPIWLRRGKPKGRVISDFFSRHNKLKPDKMIGQTMGVYLYNVREKSLMDDLCLPWEELLKDIVEKMKLKREVFPKSLSHHSLSWGVLLKETTRLLILLLNFPNSSWLGSIYRQKS